MPERSAPLTITEFAEKTKRMMGGRKEWLHRMNDIGNILNEASVLMFRI